MIRFNNYPPTMSGDVEFTPEGQDAIYTATHAYGEDASANMLYAYGEAVGHVILSAMNKTSSFVEIVKPLVREVETSARINRTEFRAGIVNAMTAVEQSREQGVTQ